MKKEPVYSYALPLRVKRHKPSELPDIANAFKAFANSKNSNRSRVAKALGLPQATLANLLKSRNPRIELLLALSEGLEHNLLSLYLPLLPERLRETDETRALREKVEQLEEEKQALQLKIESYEREREMMQAFMKMKR